MTDPTSARPDLEVVHGDADAEELAALIAVVGEAYSREAADARSVDEPSPVWNRTRRALRKPLRRDIPWGRYSG